MFRVFNSSVRKDHFDNHYNDNLNKMSCDYKAPFFSKDHIQNYVQLIDDELNLQINAVAVKCLRLIPVYKVTGND